MDTSQATYKTDLADRVLFFDGESVVSPEQLLTLIDQGLNIEGIHTTFVTDEIQQFNALVPSEKRIVQKTGCKPLSFDWNLPEPYKSWSDQDVIDHIIDRWADACNDEDVSSEESDMRAKRVSDELWMYKRLNLLPILRAIICVINTLRENNVVWGVGRGSSVSSYVLYLIGAHDVDSVKYDLDFSEFLRDPSPSN